MAGEPKPDCPVAVASTPGYVDFLDSLDEAIASSDSQARSLALLVVDLSRIEMLVQRLGHRKICQILDDVNTRLLEIKRPSDILSRINEYRFALIIPDLKFPEMADLAANRIIESLDGLRSLTGVETKIHPKTGVALFPKHGQSADELLLAAETAAQGTYSTDAWVIHAGSPDHKKILKSKLYEAELESAYMKSGFELFYQPKISLKTCELYGAEALIRWNHPEYGSVSPDLLVPLIEKSHLLQEITLWILNTALNQSMLMRKQFPDFKVAVNLTPELLASPDLVDLVTRALRIWNADPALLILEVTETSTMVNFEISQQNLLELSEMGILLSIDDFGTGYSSYSYLQKLPINELKIDRTFVTNLLEGKNNKILVQSMINLGRDLGINVLAEGIETMEVMQCLADMGCGYGQGFHIAKPMPADAMLQWIDISGRKQSPETN